MESSSYLSPASNSKKGGRERLEGGPSLEHNCEHVAVGRAETRAAGGSSGTKILSSVEVEEESTNPSKPHSTNATKKLEVKKCPG